MATSEMNLEEIEQFLTCSRVGRIAVSLETSPYIVPVGYVYTGGVIAFHTCMKGLKVETIRRNPAVCFEVDECASDTSWFKSVIIFGKAAIIDERSKMIPYLQKLIDKYRIPTEFDDYMSKRGRDKEKELQAVRICIITPEKITGRKRCV
ncbi:MAG: pyridoxamine 5'-phosphate oxidase family protein [Candidatus Bathyarchaeota archaeon]|jgi:nitroimidazol reductase NimA-like FMN-containing flavoprotein (pyridoxamine 5'-phosphate oxidase superfamily)|nr:pyridoxamine 5'-phosphate oxidase family protein [Candidatus Bathyarchaeota archaeon]